MMSRAGPRDIPPGWARPFSLSLSALEGLAQSRWDERGAPRSSGASTVTSGGGLGGSPGLHTTRELVGEALGRCVACALYRARPTLPPGEARARPRWPDGRDGLGPWGATTRCSLDDIPRRPHKLHAMSALGWLFHNLLVSERRKVLPSIPQMRKPGLGELTSHS